MNECVCVCVCNFVIVVGWKWFYWFVFLTKVIWRGGGEDRGGEGMGSLKCGRVGEGKHEGMEGYIYRSYLSEFHL